MTQVYAKTINISNECYKNNKIITNVNLNSCNINDMRLSFYNCFNLTDVSNLNSDVTNMYQTFYNCFNLVNAPVIPNSVTNIWGAFDTCSNLTGDVIIHSEVILDATDCFNNTSLTKNVYIPFQNNGVNTLTYNSFINAGYDELGTTNGVYLKDLATYQN